MTLKQTVGASVVVLALLLAGTVVSSQGARAAASATGQPGRYQIVSQDPLTKVFDTQTGILYTQIPNQEKGPSVLIVDLINARASEVPIPPLSRK